jgi:NAD(P)-dependent dehydrogenase (short-subunit alcohol dehydrogenase family)
MGSAVVRRLAGAGHRIVGVDQRAADVTADLSTSKGRERAIAEIIELCDGPIDRLVCCAGLGPSAEAELIAAVNYFGVVELLDGLHASLRSGKDPSVVVIGSNEASLWNWEGDPLPEAYLTHGEPRVRELLHAQPKARASHVAYASSKQAVTVATRRRALAWGNAGIRLNVVAPGAVQTPLLEACEQDPRFAKAVKEFVPPLGRRAQADEIASVVDFLLGPEAAYVHGSVVFVDGGIDANFRPGRF